MVRNYIPSYKQVNLNLLASAISLQVVEGGWNIADCVSRAYDVEGMHFGTVPICCQTDPDNLVDWCWAHWIGSAEVNTRLILSSLIFDEHHICTSV